MKNNTKFLQYNYYLHSILTPTDINLAINEFYIEILTKQTTKENICIIFKLETLEGDLLNISPLYIEKINNIEDIKEVFSFYWNYQLSLNKTLKIKKLIFIYKFISPDVENVSTIFNCSKKVKLVNILPENFINLPNNRLLETWGNDITINNNETYLVNRDDEYSYYIISINNEYFVWLKNEESEIQYFHDIYDTNNKSNNTFIRIVNNITLYYCNGIHSII